MESAIYIFFGELPIDKQKTGVWPVDGVRTTLLSRHARPDATRQSYDESVFQQQQINHDHRIQPKLRLQAQKLGYQLVPIISA